jgi:hypothetical protein
MYSIRWRQAAPGPEIEPAVPLPRDFRASGRDFRANVPSKPADVSLWLARSALIDLDRLHHAHLLVVHHVTMQHEDAVVVEEA